MKWYSFKFLSPILASGLFFSFQIPLVLEPTQLPHPTSVSIKQRSQPKLPNHPRAAAASTNRRMTQLAQKRPLSPNQPPKSISIASNDAVPVVADDTAIQSLHLVIYLRQRQVTLYEGSTRLRSYPIAVGRQGWETPTGRFQIRDMRQNPVWINPFTGKAVSAHDPQNPLGGYWIGFWTDGKNWVGFHGTPDATSVGKAASHGCIRMYKRDIEDLFYQVTPGTPVIVKG